jgi:hypothetical protein
MNTLLTKLVPMAILGQTEAIRRNAKVECQMAREPLPFALAALPVIAGNDLEADGYRRISSHEAQSVYALFLTASTVIARRLLQAHPSLTDEVLAHDWIKGHLETGPLKRLSQTDRAIKALRALLADSRQLTEYKNRGLLGWDNGDIQGAAAVIYGWRKVVTKQRGIFQSVSRLHREAREILANALADHPENQFLQIIDHRVRLAWDSPARVRRSNSIPALESLAEGRGNSEHVAAIRLLALSSLFDAGLRFREPTRSRDALSKLQRLLVPNEPEHPRIMIMRAWAEARGGNPVEAQQLASEVAKIPEVIPRVNAAQVLQTIGNTQAAKVILKEVSAEFLPRPNPLASPILNIP